LKGLSEVAELEFSVASQVVCLLAPTSVLFSLSKKILP
jgi:hypothetical protein